jgi:hypothetical protein
MPVNIDRTSRLHNVEFWTATGLLLLYWLSLFDEYGDPASLDKDFDENVFYYATYAIVLYVTFLLLNFIIIPGIIQRKLPFSAPALIVVTAGVVWYGKREWTLIAVIFIIVYEIVRYTAIYLWLRSETRTRQLTALRVKLGQSEANMGLLREQINPHFLFNALNTIYGTALQENASRTGEAIQQLGDMMRFMLHENVQAMIPVARELEYLHHYIALQKLRICNLPQATLTVDIQPIKSEYHIAPMLLIPFVENAFKHGISMHHPSRIHISLVIKGDTLNFQVVNNRLPVNTSILPGHESGIGLTNVSQRLKLAYPNRHVLTVAETNEEFSVNLVLSLV